MTATGITQISPLVPGLFTADASGQGLLAGNVLRVRGDGSRQYEPVATYDAAQQKFFAVPIDFGPATDQLFLDLLAGLDQINVLLPRILADSGELTLLVTIDGKAANPVKLVLK